MYSQEFSNYRTLLCFNITHMLLWETLIVRSESSTTKPKWCKLNGNKYYTHEPYDIMAPDTMYTYSPILHQRNIKVGKPPLAAGGVRKQLRSPQLESITVPHLIETNVAEGDSHAVIVMSWRLGANGYLYCSQLCGFLIHLATTIHPFKVCLCTIRRG